MDNFEDILASVGINVNPITSTTVNVVNKNTNQTVRIDTETTQEEPVIETVNLSDGDYDDILSDMGFDECDDDEWSEEDIDEAEREAIENETPIENRDLDTEEDAAWERFHEIGTTSPQEINTVNTSDDSIHFHYPDGHTVSVPIIHAEPDDSAVSTAHTSEPSHVEETPSEEPVHHAIQPNSPTLVIDDSTSRFSGTEWYNEIQKQRIILAGLGGIGSWTALQLARMSPECILLYDDDTVESANMSGQLYGISHVGMYKSDALRNIIGIFAPSSSVYSTADRFTDSCEAGPIMICGFDNMLARRVFFESWLRYIAEYDYETPKSKCLFIDGRLSIDKLQVFCISGDDEYAKNKYWNEFLFTDTEAEETVCSMKQTTYLACMIGSIIVNLFTNWVANSLNPVLPYDLPFFTEYDSQNMIFKTEN